MEYNLEDYLWVEKYRPTKLEDLILDENVRDRLNEYVKEKQIPHLLLVGTAGIGKTTLAKILTESILDCEYLNINASDESGIDTIRSKVKSFARTATIGDNLKVVVFGEADGLTKNAQDSLKEIIEECSDTTRFIFTANNLSKLSEPIISRCQKIDLKFSFNDYVKGCAAILKNEDVKTAKVPFLKICKESYPDFRKAINTLQSNIVDGVLVDNVDASDGSFAKTVWDMITTGDMPETIREHYIQNQQKFGEYHQLAISMAKYAFDNFEPTDNRKMILSINDMLFKDTSVVDKELNFYCLIIKLTS